MRTLLIIDDPQTRLALQFLLNYQPGFVVVGAVGSHLDPQVLVDGVHPDVVLIDWDLHGRSSGLALLQGIRQAQHETKVVAMSSDLYAESAVLAAGADGFASKGDPPEKLLALLHGLELHWKNH